MDGLSERKKKILRAVVESYVETAEPVGSKTLAAQSALNVSPATIRNEMSDLEELGLLEQPHTSAGRIPSSKGYRLYVNELMTEHRLSLDETKHINEALKGKLKELDRVIASAGQAVSKLTKYPAFALTPGAERVMIRRFDVLKVEEHAYILVVMVSNSAVKNRLVRLPQSLSDEQLHAMNLLLNQIFVNLSVNEITPELMGVAQRASGGAYGLISLAVSFAMEILQEQERQQMNTYGLSNLFAQPEFRDMERAEPVMQYLSEEHENGHFPLPQEKGKNQILIGPENVAEALKNSSVIMASYDIGDGMQGVIGVVGPTRMDYAKLSARMEYFASTMTSLLGGGTAKEELSESEQE